MVAPATRGRHRSRSRLAGRREGGTSYGFATVLPRTTTLGTFGIMRMSALLRIEPGVVDVLAGEERVVPVRMGQGSELTGAVYRIDGQEILPSLRVRAFPKTPDRTCSRDQSCSKARW